MIRASIAALALVATVGTTLAAQSEDSANNRLVIINGHNHHVIYDDGNDDLICVTRKHFVGWDDDGHRIYRRTMHCR